MMRTLLISLAAGVSALAAAAPAAAQYYPAPPPPPGYGQYHPGPNGYGYGHEHAYGQIRSLRARIDHIQRRIERLRERRAISRNEAEGLRGDARRLERRLRYAAYNGLHPRERYEIEARIVRLEQKVRHEVRDGRRGGWDDHDRRGRGRDRDRDGRDDRYEDDRGRDRDDD